MKTNTKFKFHNTIPPTNMKLSMKLSRNISHKLKIIKSGDPTLREAASYKVISIYQISEPDVRLVREAVKAMSSVMFKERRIFSPFSFHVSFPSSHILSFHRCIVCLQISQKQILSLQISSDVGAEELFDCENSSIKKGLLWQQRDKIFSRWKERYFILTRDLLQCFKKETSKITEMGGFIFKVRLIEYH